MLSVSTYPTEYVRAARRRIDEQVAAYCAMAVAATGLTGASREAFDSALDDLEVAYFNNLVLALEGHFMHRARGQELKDGNPCNEVRVLSASLTGNDGRLLTDRQIRLRPETSVLGYSAGDEIRVREADFQRLATAFFADIEAKFVE